MPKRSCPDGLFGAAEFVPIQDNREFGVDIRDDLKKLRASEAMLNEEIKLGLRPAKAEAP